MNNLQSTATQKKKKVFVYGFPGIYGGARTELYHQIILWQALGREVHIIPDSPGVKKEPLYLDIIKRGVKVHDKNRWEHINEGDPFISFGNRPFFDNIRHIHRRTKNIIFINCMTWIFPQERELMKEGLISTFLYQNEEVRQKNMQLLKAVNPDPSIHFLTFKPYFHSDDFPFIRERSDEHFGCGRISRQDAEKYARFTLHTYQYFVSPKPKAGLFLGFGERSAQKIGKPQPWIKLAANNSVISQQDFYKHCDIILQPMDTTENWPRIGFEAMSSGSVLIVDNRGGWSQMVKHGQTGWLCNCPQDFIYYASKMAYEPAMRNDMAEAARQHALALGGLRPSLESWREIFNTIEH